MEMAKIADVVELAGLSRATFYEHFRGKEACYAAAYEDAVERLVSVVEVAAGRDANWNEAVSSGLRAALEFLAADPALAHLLLVESLAAARPARLEHERSLVRLAEALRPPAEAPGGEPVPEETLRLLAGGLASHISGRVLAGEGGRLAENHGLLLQYLLAPTAAANARVATG
jgi:AcrR family transcriptional regulator